MNETISLILAIIMGYFWYKGAEIAVVIILSFTIFFLSFTIFLIGKRIQK